MPAFYNRPRTIDDIVDHTVGKALDQFGIRFSKMKRWKDPLQA
jgi:4-hydroxy-3-polyprenylbenzoate decarboxylase